MRVVRTLALAAIVAGTASAAYAETTLRVGLAEDPDMLDPSLGRTTVGRSVMTAVCDKLFDINENLEIVPVLALSYETVDEGKGVVIKLRPDVKFHDGETLDAAAVKATMDRHKTMEGSFRKADVAAIEEVQVVDPLTVKLVLSNPFSPLIYQLTDRPGMIMSPKAIAEAGDQFGLHPVCAGPYKFVERVQQDRIVVEKFADYWNADNVHIDRIVYQPIADPTIRLANLKSGTLDLIERVLATDIPDVRNDSNLVLASRMDLGFQMIAINVGHGEAAKLPLGSDARIRKAFELAIDRDVINQVVFDGEFRAGNQWVNPDNYYYQSKFPIPKRDVEAAKKLLAESGTTLPVKVDFMVPNNPELQQVVEIIQAMTAEAGFDVQIRTTENATAMQEADRGNFQAFIVTSSGRADPDVGGFLHLHTGAASNYGGYSNATVDELFSQGRIASDPAERKAIYEKLTEQVMADTPVIFLYHRLIILAHTAKLEGYTVVPDGLIRVVGLKLNQ